MIACRSPLFVVYIISCAGWLCFLCMLTSFGVCVYQQMCVCTKKTCVCVCVLVRCCGVCGACWVKDGVGWGGVGAGTQPRGCPSCGAPTLRQN